MSSVLSEGVPHRIAEIARVRPRGRGFGIKGSAHIVLWPAYDSYNLGVLIGMLYGDGNLIRRSTALQTGKWRIEFCEGDIKLVQEYARLTRKLFNINPTIRNRGTWYEAYYCSRIVYEFMTHVGEHPNGKTTGKLRIPGVARNNSSTLRGFIAGLFSVEGSVRLGSNVRLVMEMLEPVLVRELYVRLKTFGHQPHIYHYLKDEKKMYGLYIFGFKECQAFLSNIGLIGKREKRLTSFLSLRRLATSARKQPGGREIYRM